MKKVFKKILIGALLIGALLSQVEAYQTCKTDIQVTFKSGINVVTGLTEGIQIYK